MKLTLTIVLCSLAIALTAQPINSDQVNYNLSIQSSNNDGIWGSEIKSMDILIKRPIYSRWYAWLIYGLILLSLIYAFYKMKINHITNLSKAREEERTKIRERSARDFHDEVGSLVT